MIGGAFGRIQEKNGGVKMDTSKRMREIKKLGSGIDTNTTLLWYKHGSWLIEQVEKAEWLQYINSKLEKENDSLCDKLADIRNLFDESDMKAEGHGMEDAIASPYAVACYAESKLKRLIEENQILKNAYSNLDEKRDKQVKELQEELDKWIAEFMI